MNKLLQYFSVISIMLLLDMSVEASVVYGPGQYIDSSTGSVRTITIQWSTTQEVNNDYFVIERSEDGITYDSLDMLAGAGNSTMTNYYEFIDTTAIYGVNYCYRIKSVEFNGSTDYNNLMFAGCDILLGIENCFYDGDNQQTTIYNFPNPYNEFMNIDYIIQQKGYVNISVFDASGEKKAVLVNEKYHSVGNYTVTLDGRSFSAGLYLLTLATESGTISKRIVRQ